MPIAVKYTYRDLLSIPEDRNRYELFDGDLIVTPAPSVEHQIAVGNIFSFLNAHVRGNSLGLVLIAPVDVYFSEESVVQPDVVFVGIERRSIVAKRRVEGAPDLVVEVLSTSTGDRDRGYKFKLYAQEGVREYWLADPETRSLEVYALGEEGYRLVEKYEESSTLRSEIFPDLEFEVGALWM